MTPNSLGTPHTGTQRYQDGVTKIPTAAITVEDADYIDRMQQSNTTVRVRLEMGCDHAPAQMSHDIIAEVRGAELPDEVVVLGGHLDSWVRRCISMSLFSRCCLQRLPLPAFVGGNREENTHVMQDVGTGAMDDGGGVLATWHALRSIATMVKKGSVKRPRRTIRVVLWTDEEQHGTGARVRVTV